LRGYATALAAINAREPEFLAVPGPALAERVRGGDLNDVFAAVREAARRTLGLRPFDVQIVAGLAMADETIVEMQTGEGKTLAAVAPAVWHALSGKGVHVLTFNDYLARRDAEWMRPIYDLLGVTVAFVGQDMPPEARRQAYSADVTYVTAKEAGFDHLRDSLAYSTNDVVHKAFHCAIVDEADSLLIDEARSPLVIAGLVRSGPKTSADGLDGDRPTTLATLVAEMTPGIDFDTDEYGRDVELTDAGIDRAERVLACGRLHDPENYALLTELNCALHARVLLRRDVDYIVRGGRIEIVDEFTGRVVQDRHWPDGLQAALEAKEAVAAHPGGRILGTMTLQHFLRGYPHLCGMTGTARDAAEELFEFYGLKSTVIPSNRPTVRADQPDVVFTHREAKERAVVEEVGRAYASGRPVLVGTLTVEESEGLAAKIRERGIDCAVLNAKNDAEEAAIIAGAGRPHAVTISTNMAGRGTDIRLGGRNEEERAAVVATGGLYVIGTNRHESRRVDQQLRGRAGRQGDPGESRFFVSLEDQLLVRYGIGELIPRRFWPAPSEQPIESPVVRREIARAQRVVEGQNLEIRRTLWEYTSLLETERRDIMQWRETVLNDPDIAPAVRAVTLYCIDRGWRDHLAFAADLREGIHLVSLSGADPLTRYTTDVVSACSEMKQEIDRRISDARDRVRTITGGFAIDGEPIIRPASTWTYLINDDPFRHQIAMRLIGAGKSTFAIFAALVASPLLILWTVADRISRRRRPRRSTPLQK
jgi:preprotein translocase subunit SecA